MPLFREAIKTNYSLGCRLYLQLNKETCGLDERQRRMNDFAAPPSSLPQSSRIDRTLEKEKNNVISDILVNESSNQLTTSLILTSTS